MELVLFHKTRASVALTQDLELGPCLLSCCVRRRGDGIGLGLSPQGLPLALLKATRVDADVPRLAAARTRHTEGREELGKGSEDLQGEGLSRVALGKGEDSLELAKSKILRGTRHGMRKFRRSHR
jgi:hypothetical protein